MGGDYTGTVDYSEAIDERDILYQPGMDSDISLVTMLGVRMAIATIINPTAEQQWGLGNQLYSLEWIPRKRCCYDVNGIRGGHTPQ